MIPVRVLVILVTLFIFPCAKVWGADWKWFCESKDGTIKYYYDTESLVRTSEGYIRFWWKSIRGPARQPPRSLSEDIPDSFINLIEINCSLREFRHLQVNKYYKKNGQVVRMETKPSQEKWDYISPREHISPYWQVEDLYKIICSKVKE